MRPPIYALLAGGAGVTAIVSTRIYPAGEAPHGVSVPYITWQVVSGIPEAYLDELPDIDSFRVQINLFADDDAICQSLEAAVRAVLEPEGEVTQLADERDPETKRWRIALDASLWTER